METNLRPIATEWYKPRITNRSLGTNLQLGRVVAEFYGKDSIGLCRKIGAGGSFSRGDADRIDESCFKSISQTYHLPKRTDPQEFYMQQQKGAVAVIDYFQRLIPELAKDFELKDEIVRLSDRPSLLLRYLSMPAGGIDPTLAYEAQRHAVLVYQLGMINSRSLNGRLRTVLSDVQGLLNEKLFVGPEGHGERSTVECYHDDETNEVVGFPDRGDKRPLTAHLKRIPVIVRQVEDIGKVMTSPRKKNDSVAIVKSWMKAQSNSGIIHINQAVQDSIGMTFVVMDDTIPPKQLADLVVSIIKSGSDSDLRCIPKILTTEVDDNTDADHGQSPGLNFNARRKLWFEGLPTPIELIFYSREAFLNSKLEVGERDRATGLYMGRGHDLFELRRAMIVARIPFPREIYGVNDYDLNNAFVNRSKQVAYGQRIIYKAA